MSRGAGWPFCLWLAAIGAAGADVPAAAHYEDPVDRYGHRVLGAEGEYDTLAVTLTDGRVIRTTLGAPLVFEDVAPRLVDVDGDGTPEIVTVESHERLGARLSLWRAAESALERLAATPHIGTRFRWLAPVAIADLDGDGAVEIAYVDRPHLAKVLRIWRYRDGALTEVAAAGGFSNHRIGWDYIEGGLRDCGSGPEMVLATGDWSSVVVMRYDGDLAARRIGPYSPGRIAAALACR